MAKADHTVHPNGWSVDVTAWLLMASLTEEEIEVSTESVRGISRYCGTHLIPSYKNRNKRRDALLLIDEALGWWARWTRFVYAENPRDQTRLHEVGL